MKTLVLFVPLVLATSAAAHSQGRMLSGGGAAHYLRQYEEEESWMNAKKLSVEPLPPGELPLPTQSGSMDPDRMQTGDIGSLTYWAFTVLSVVDENNAILTIGNNSTIWLESFPTADLVTDQSVRLIGPVKVTGTKEFETVLGASRKVRSIRFLSKDEINLRNSTAKPTVEEKHEFTEFHSKVGTSVEARFIKYVGGLAYLETKDGRTLKLNLSVFTDDDADKIRDWARQSRVKTQP